MKLAGTVVLFNPNEEHELIQNIYSYLPLVDKLYVMDNSTQDVSFLDNIKQLKKVKYVSLNGNKGIAKALKVATQLAIDDGYDFILSMDQDSGFPIEDFYYIKNYLQNADISNLGIIATYIYEYNLKPTTDDKNYIVDIDDVITSGSIINLKNYSKIDGYKEELFIDHVDNDICYQFKEKNMEIKVFPNIKLKHNLGKTEKVRFLWYKKEIVTHNPLRYYYMYRNYHYLLKTQSETYKSFLKRKKCEFSLRATIKRLLLEKSRIKILKMIIKGIKDGKKGVLGPCNID